MTKIRLAEGGGGEATAKLIKEVFQKYLCHPELMKGNDAAILPPAGTSLAVSTDAFVVTPWRFPGGDIGRLALCGTVNDLTMMGAEPLGITAAFIIEEGFARDDLDAVVRSLALAAEEAGVSVVAGDTKVVGKGAADGIFIITSGVGGVIPGACLGGEMARSGDKVIVSGSIGDHGAAILLARGELGLSGELYSDVAPLNTMLLPLVREYIGQIRVLRDPTRGGVGVTLNEIARQARVSIRLEAEKIPVRPEVQGLSELLGLDPLYLANEGKALLIVAPDNADEIVTKLRNHHYGAEAKIIGTVGEDRPGMVTVRDAMGGERMVPLGSGEHLPRIC